MPPYENTDSMPVGLFGQLSLDDGDETGIKLPLTGVAVQAEIHDFIGEVTLSQSYKNNETVPLEAIYHFPVDEAATVCGFKAEYDDGRVVTGTVKEKEEAKKEFDKAISKGHQANLLEQKTTKRDIFSLRVGNLGPKHSVKIVMTYITALKAQEDAIAFILPTCIAPRYSPFDSKLSLEEATAVAPPITDVQLFGLDIDIKFYLRSNIKSIKCPSHPSERSLTSRLDGKVAGVTLKDIAMDRDLVILVEEEEAHQPRASIERDSKGNMAGFVTIFPHIEFKDQSREIAFVIDRSGSMGWSRGAAGKSQIDQARDALLLFLRALPPTCTFNIIGFGSRFVPLFDRPKPYDDHSLQLATEYAMNMNADMGGTEIMSPLDHVFRQGPSADNVQRQVFVLTDGQVSNDSQVFELIRENCGCDRRNNSRLFSLGIGAGVSRHLVQGMARAGSGTARFVEGGDSNALRAKVLGQLKQALQPALDHVSIAWNLPPKPTTMAPAKKDTKQTLSPIKTLLGYRSPDADDAPEPRHDSPRIFPSTNPPIFNREKYLSFAIFPKGISDIPESVTIKCESPDGPLETTVKISGDDVFDGSIAHKMAARTAISEYEDNKQRFPLHHEMARGNVLTDAEALQLALENGIVTEKTAVIAVLEEPVVEAGTEAKKQVIPQHLPNYPPTVQQRFVPMGGVGSGVVALRSAPDGSRGMASHIQFCSAPKARKKGFGFARAAAMPAQAQSVPVMPCSAAMPCSVPMVGFGSGDNTKRTGLFGSAPRFDSLGSINSLSSESLMATSLGLSESPSVFSRASGSQGPVGFKDMAKSVRSRFRMNKSAGAPQRQAVVHKRERDVKAPKANKSDDFLQFCLLQKADGSFSLSKELALLLHLDVQRMNHMASQTRGSDSKTLEPVIFATLLAIAGLRAIFSAQHDQWELQEGKARRFVESRGFSPSEADKIVSDLEASLLKK